MKKAIKAIIKGMVLDIEITRERKELEEQWKNLAEREIEFLEKNKDKKFLVSQKFYKAALNEMVETFRWGEERGMITFLEEKNNSFLFGEKFYPHSQLFRNRCVFPLTRTPLSRLGIGWDYKNLINLAKIEEKFPYCCHTHLLSVGPSETDFENEGVVGPVRFPQMIIFFKNPSKKFQEFSKKIFETRPEWQEITQEEEKGFLKEHRRIVDRKIYEQKPFSLPKDFQATLKNQEPKILLFYRVLNLKFGIFPKKIDREIVLEIE